ncbi:MAG: ergothioneine biosynthesis protein EgtB [Bacteroidia bacterium]|nr:ergothioneine biosynthesis protein EgtB [Bacteroidia bacterium]NNF29828.1 ergothioneine biosynthesis protein EgtB [Flavobacteriaceae bacterium]MBT8275972.1 ergothioneine biosynthesis protein EgtB [Bacteroidia bacterium]NNJ82982.1 ergothioneine biosynthesis protein EgtB [Flavobacteriaceae bacterium]NNK53812.1 ergothioneine biosynthesis protein EgtB [Flavobacteriaceae bacterium]
MIQTKNIVSFFLETRAYTESLCKPLEIEDYVVQPVIDVSPPKWHLGHTTWFFEEFILKPHKQGYNLFHEDFAFVFNSYYESVGKRVVRSDRGNLSRPGVAKVYDYRHYVTNEMKEFLSSGTINEEILSVLEIGIHHEKQHQELLITDIKYILGNNPLLPAYNDQFNEDPIESQNPEWISMEEGIYEIGHNGEDFCYDNELGRHKVYLHEYSIANKLVTNSEFIDFIESGGYSNFKQWHAEGWDWVQQQNITQPMYWHRIQNEWHHYTLNGLQKVDPGAPLSHISYFEAFAFAEWKGCRLPTEFEWEAAQGAFQWGLRWEWTESAYLPYPGYAKAEGAIGEYNGKFMVNQKVLRGGSVATPDNHTRHTYRNFFQTNLRWQFTGLRLAK